MPQPKQILPLAQLLEMKRQSEKEKLFIRMTDSLIKVHEDFLSKLQEVSDTINKKMGPKGDRGAKGDKGDPGKDAEEVDVQAIIGYIQKGIKIPVLPSKKEIASMIREMFPMLPQGFTDKDKREIINEVFTKLKSEVKMPEINHSKILDDLIPLLKKKIKITDLEGHAQTMRALESQIKQGIGYLHGGGDTLANGAGYTLVRNANGTVSLSISGAGTNILIATGTVDDSNTFFTFVSKPKIINVNGAFYRENFGWSWDDGTLTATLDNPVGTGGDIYGLS